MKLEIKKYYNVIISLMFLPILFLFHNCGVHTPRALNSSGSSLGGFDHASVAAQACMECHENDRKDPNHFAGQDCKGCHTPGAWATTGGGAAAQAHNPIPTACNSCHADGMTYDEFPAGHIDIGNADCISCHQQSVNNNFVDWTGGTFAHSNTLIAQKNCNSCHSGDRPTTGAYMSQDPNLTVNSGHYGAFDCFYCHGVNNQFRDWNNTGTSHYNAAGTKIESCLPCHFGRERPQPNQASNGRIGEHRNRDNWFMPPIYDINAQGNQPGANGQLGNCYSCHTDRRSFND